MKLLQINVTANWGSTGRIAEGIGLAAQKNGFESWIAWGRYANSSQSHLMQIGKKIDYLEHGFESRIWDNHGLASRTATKNLIQQIEELRADIIHLHNIHGYYLNYPLLFKYLQQVDVPVIWTLHDCWSFTGHCVHYAVCGCDRWKNGCHHCPQKKTYPASYLFDRSAQNYLDKKKNFTSLKNLTLIPVSQWLSDEVGKSFLKDIPRQVIHNGIDTELFAPGSNNTAIREKFGFQAEETMLLGVASVWSERKGLKDFIALSKQLNSNQKIVLIGLSPEQLKEIPPNIIGIQRTESIQQLAELYSAADIFLNLSREETFGLTTVEGFSCGTPGIVYNATASPELISDDVGFVVPQGDFSAVKNAIQTIEQKGKDFYSATCRNYAVKNFSQQERFAEYIKLYQQILN